MSSLFSLGVGLRTESLKNCNAYQNLAGIPDAKIPPYRYHFKSELKLKDSREVCLITPKYAFNVESVPTKGQMASPKRMNFRK